MIQIRLLIFRSYSVLPISFDAVNAMKKVWLLRQYLLSKIIEFRSLCYQTIPTICTCCLRLQNLDRFVSKRYRLSVLFIFAQGHNAFFFLAEKFETGARDSLLGTNWPTGMKICVHIPEFEESWSYLGNAFQTDTYVRKCQDYTFSKLTKRSDKLH